MRSGDFGSAENGAIPTRRFQNYDVSEGIIDHKVGGARGLWHFVIQQDSI